MRGFALAVVTRGGLVLLRSGGRPVPLSWDRVGELAVSAGPFGPVVQLVGEEDRLQLVYLSDAQIQALRAVVRPKEGRRVREVPAIATGGGTGPAPASGSRPAAGAADRQALSLRIPDFPTALAASSSVEERGLYGAARALSVPPLRPDFLEDHLRELHGLFRASLARRHREAVGAPTLGAAALALDGRALFHEAGRALDSVGSAVRQAYEAQVRRIAAERKLAWKQAVKFMPASEEEMEFRQRLGRGLGPLQGLSDALAELGHRIREVEALGGSEFETLHGRWVEVLSRFDRAFARAWVQVGTTTLQQWEEGLCPRLSKVAAEKRRGAFGWLKFLGG